uniref:Uncharacterized protein n=1 Tax=Leersia perrieri TaxID=77586 RepID=A0A0D9VDS4_9ORYZ
MNSMGAAGIHVRLQAILVMSLVLLQMPFLPCTLATGGTRGKSLELVLIIGRETHHEDYLDQLATRKSTRSLYLSGNLGAIPFGGRVQKTSLGLFGPGPVVEAFPGVRAEADGSEEYGDGHKDRQTETGEFDGIRWYWHQVANNRSNVPLPSADAISALYARHRI